MNKESNTYTFIFAIAMVVIVASLLSFAAIQLKEPQTKNVNQEKKQEILRSIGIQLSRAEADAQFDNYIEEQLVLNKSGEIVEGKKAFEVELQREIRKPIEEQVFPIYVAKYKGEKYFIVPLRGAGLWNAIWGYISLKSDLSTVIGVTFGHAGETPGLGAEITQQWFQDQYQGKNILSASDSKFVSVKTIKGGADVNDSHGVDAISGATITCDGVTDMIQERIENYLPYFKTIKNIN